MGPANGHRPGDLDSIFDKMGSSRVSSAQKCDTIRLCLSPHPPILSQDPIESGLFRPAPPLGLCGHLSFGLNDWQQCLLQQFIACRTAGMGGLESPSMWSLKRHQGDSGVSGGESNTHVSQSPSAK